MQPCFGSRRIFFCSLPFISGLRANLQRPNISLLPQVLELYFSQLLSCTAPLFSFGSSQLCSSGKSSFMFIGPASLPALSLAALPLSRRSLQRLVVRSLHPFQAKGSSVKASSMSSHFLKGFSIGSDCHRSTSP